MVIDAVASAKRSRNGTAGEPFLAIRHRSSVALVASCGYANSVASKSYNSTFMTFLVAKLISTFSQPSTRPSQKAEARLLAMLVRVFHHLDRLLAMHRRDHKAIVEGA